jgi:arginyl-tRNA synthetase
MSTEEIYETLEYPKHEDMGDYAFPCFKLAKTFRKAPNMISADLVETIGNHEYFENIEAVAAYINFKIDKGVFAKSVLEAISEQGDAYGSTNIGENKNLIVEFSSVNIAKAFHMGHIRSTMIGNALYKIFGFLGYNAVSINHLGDYGTQFGKMIVAYKMWGDKELILTDPVRELVKLYVKFHDEAEKDETLNDTAREWFTKLENGNQEAYDLWAWMKELSLVEFDRVYDLLGVHFDSYAGESFYSDKIPAVLEEMREKNVMVKSEGAEIVDLEEYNMPPALITKKDGSSLYITRDIAAAMYRKNHYNFDKNIYVVGAPQQLHFKQWMKIIELMGHDWAKDCVHVDFGTVSLEEGSMSTRKGRVIYLEEVLQKAIDSTKAIIDEKNPNLENKDDVAKKVGVGAVVYQELSNNRIKDYTFSWESTLSFEGETGPYVMYTHARSCSVLRKADIDFKTGVDYSHLSDDASKDVIRLLSKFPEVVLESARKYEPSMVTRYVTNLAQRFNRFYHDNPILVDDVELKKARLALVDATRQTLKTGLNLVGLAAPERM